MIRALALDLGTTGIKAAALNEDGRLTGFISVPAPPLSGEGLIRESDPSLYLESARELLRDLLTRSPGDIPIGIASQRSSFLLWEKSSGHPVTPLISWQDRRAEEWCDAHSDEAPELLGATGLPLSPHYAGPKLAHLFSRDKDLSRAAGSGELLFGTLETWLLWNLSRDRVHLSELSMAGRTLLADPLTGAWSGELLDYFGVPARIIPGLSPTWGARIPISDGGAVTAMISDQAAACLAAAGFSSKAVIINLGTGGFVLSPTGPKPVRIPGYLTGPLAQDPDDRRFYALEGTINGIGAALEGLKGEAPEYTGNDPHPELFCLPDTTGIGAPFWEPSLPQLFSLPLKGISDRDRSLAVREGIIFRVCQIVEDLGAAGGERAIYLAGGMSADPFIAAGLSACLELPIQRLAEKEATLLGTLLLASSSASGEVTSGTIPLDAGAGNYLPEKFRRWKVWVDSVIHSHRMSYSAGDYSIMKNLPP